MFAESSSATSLMVMDAIQSFQPNLGQKCRNCNHLFPILAYASQLQPSIMNIIYPIPVQPLEKIVLFNFVPSFSHPYTFYMLGVNLLNGGLTMSAISTSHKVLKMVKSHFFSQFGIQSLNNCSIFNVKLPKHLSLSLCFCWEICSYT